MIDSELIPYDERLEKASAKFFHLVAGLSPRKIGLCASKNLKRPKVIDQETLNHGAFENRGGSTASIAFLMANPIKSFTKSTKPLGNCLVITVILIILILLLFLYVVILSVVLFLIKNTTCSVCVF